jgi:hypothetical protein
MDIVMKLASLGLEAFRDKLKVLWYTSLRVDLALAFRFVRT